MVYHPKNTLDTLEGIETLETWKMVEDKEWNNKLYKNTEITIGNPLKAEEEAVKAVFVEPSDPEMERSIQKLYKEK